MNKKFVYLILDKLNGFYKIGISVNANERIKTLQTGNAGELILIDEVEVEGANKLEKELHSKYNECRVRGEWFRFDKNQLN